MNPDDDDSDIFDVLPLVMIWPAAWFNWVITFSEGVKAYLRADPLFWYLEAVSCFLLDINLAADVKVPSLGFSNSLYPDA